MTYVIHTLSILQTKDFNILKNNRKQIDTMAAKGYLDTFKVAKESVGLALYEKTNPKIAAEIFASKHQGWHQKLFKPSVEAGILERLELF